MKKLTLILAAMNKIKVLLVEDETSLAMILSDTLEAQGFDLLHALRQCDGEPGFRDPSLGGTDGTG